MKLAVALCAALAALPAVAQDKKKADPALERGRYLVVIGGCNDCHTPGYGPNGGKTPESQWLVGDGLGWYGPWGTTYASNLRIYVQGMSENEWVKKAKNLTARPPMPWFNVRAMSEADLRAMYKYIRSLQPVGKPAPAYLPPDKTPPQPYVAFPK